jgi:hypothetical protein
MRRMIPRRKMKAAPANEECRLSNRERYRGCKMDFRIVMADSETWRLREFVGLNLHKIGIRINRIRGGFPPGLTGSGHEFLNHTQDLLRRADAQGHVCFRSQELNPNRMLKNQVDGHCEERSDEAISLFTSGWKVEIASPQKARLAMTG